MCVRTEHLASASPSSASLQSFKSTGALALILTWNVMVGILYGLLIYVPVTVMLYPLENAVPFSVILSATMGYHAVGSFVWVLYPFGGLIADVCCGRYRMISASLLVTWLGFLFVFVNTTLFVVYHYRIYDQLVVPCSVLGLLGSVVVLLGLSGFESNVVQFGLDQMLDSSSEKLSLFLHWFVWTESLGIFIVQMPLEATLCTDVGFTLTGSVMTLYLAVCTVSIIFGYCKRGWFHCEGITSNPYKKIYQVIKYTVKHNRPVRHRSALTYSDDERPLRIDYAKVKYGGPFRTEVVEDVKTFFRILLVLLAVTLMSCFDVPTVYIFHVFGLHLGKNLTNHSACTYEWLLLQSGSWSNLIPVLSIPVYILVVYPFVKKWVPRIILRLGVGIALKVLSVSLMFILQLVASHTAPHHNNSTCLFVSEYRVATKYPLSPTLEFPTPVLAVLNLLNGVSTPLISIATFEFISAQSPHSMKGVLLGVFYAFRGVFTALSCLLMLPFAQESLWRGKSGMLGCGFYYYLSNTLLALVGLAVFLLVTRWYHYRERDDPPYKYQYVEDYYSRYASRPTGRLMEDSSGHVSYKAI